MGSLRMLKDGGILRNNKETLRILRNPKEPNGTQNLPAIVELNNNITKQQTHDLEMTSK